MDRYSVITEVGNGTFGNVWSATDTATGEIVAIKKMKKKYFTWEECLNLREVKSLRIMNHPNIVKLKEVIRENDALYFIFEYMECNLYQLMKNRGKPFSEAEVRNLCFQIFHALAYMHRHGYFHRDLKPENLLVTKDAIKIADFGLAREISSHPPFTEYVSTRWYRAPEVLLHSSVYNAAVDIWAMGAIVAELLTCRPLFPGISEADELYKICRIIGTPDVYSWSEGLQMANLINYRFPQFPGFHLSSLMPSASVEAVNLVSWLCTWDPCKRPTPTEALQHPFFLPCFYIPPSLRMREVMAEKTTPSDVVKSALDQKNAQRNSWGAQAHDTKPLCKFSAAMAAAVFLPGFQRRLENDYHDVGKTGKAVPNCPKQGYYRPPPENNTAGPFYSDRDAGLFAEAAEKLAQMTLNSVPEHLPRPGPPKIKDGVCQLRSDSFDLRRLPDPPAGRSYYTRRVYGKS